ncbi:50S ribosomal protein L1 [Candidatus Daviesbacteria bacterium]|nr:50S ribosomal protein L1 [Candidatus Daviesbacteria bacterium]
MGRPKVKKIDDSVKEKLDVRSEKLDKEVGNLKLEKNPISNIQSQNPASNVQHPTSKKKPGKAKPRSKKYQEIAKDLDRTKAYPLSEAVDLVKKLSYSKFNATLEAHINTAQTGIRGLVSLPFATGRNLRILSFEGSDETIEEINKGKVDFDLVVTTPQWMPKLAKVARILGPRGLMPNPKNGTITEDLKKAVESFQAGKTEYKTEPKAPVIHIAMGKLNQPTEELAANIKMLIQTLGKTRIKKVTLAPTMGPGVKIDLSSL